MNITEIKLLTTYIRVCVNKIYFSKVFNIVHSLRMEISIQFTSILKSILITQLFISQYNTRVFKINQDIAELIAINYVSLSPEIFQIFKTQLGNS